MYQLVIVDDEDKIVEGIAEFVVAIIRSAS